MKPSILVIIISILFIGCDHEEEAIDDLPESWDNMIPGQYAGGLEIFYEEDSFYMEKIILVVHRMDDYYALVLDSRTKLSVESINLNILSIENNADKNDVIYVDMSENQFYETREVGSYLNTIYINNTLYSQMEGPCVEIRLSLICLKQASIRHIFIRAKKFL